MANQNDADLDNNIDDDDFDYDYDPVEDVDDNVAEVADSLQDLEVNDNVGITNQSNNKSNVNAH